MGEVEIIARYFGPLAQGAHEALDLLDDAALISPKPGNDFVVTADGLIADRHFGARDNAGDIAFKALAVNVSDLVAKGAKPYLYFLTLCLPEPDPQWLKAFAEGLGDAQASFGCFLAGGDTNATNGPLTLSITAIGTLPKGEMVRRAGGSPGDLIYVSGTIGDAALGLGLVRDSGLGQAWGLDGDQGDHLLARYHRPAPPLALAPVLRRHASAAMDISDGLAGDFAALCRASGTGGEITADRIPLSGPAAQVLSRDPTRLETIITGGDDYEVLAAIGPQCKAAFEADAAAAGHTVVRIGVLRGSGAGVCVREASGHELTFEHAKFDHFS